MIELADGNMGAIGFLMPLLHEHLDKALPIMHKIEQTGLKGSALYIMFSDICNKDYDAVLKLCTECPNDILIDACNRQDRSGKELVQEYLNN